MHKEEPDTDIAIPPSSQQEERHPLHAPGDQQDQCGVNTGVRSSLKINGERLEQQTRNQKEQFNKIEVYLVNVSATWPQSSSEAIQQGDVTIPEPQEHCLNGGVLHQEADPDAKPIRVAKIPVADNYSWPNDRNISIDWLAKRDDHSGA